MNRLNPNEDEMLAYATVTQEELEQEARHGLEFLQSFVASKPTTIMPQVLVLGIKKNEEGETEKDARSVFVVANDFNEHEIKNKIMFSIGIASVTKDKLLPRIVVLICEAWHSKECHQIGELHKATDRTEVCVVMAKTFEKKALYYGVPILRDSQNGIHLALAELTRHEGGMSGLLDSFYRGALAGIEENKKTEWPG